MFDEHLRAHSSLLRGLDAIESFIRSPGVPDIAALTQWDRQAGEFGYATDAAISLAELIQHIHADRPCGALAAVQVMTSVAATLDAIRSSASDAGLRSHGCLNPWRIVLRDDGSVQVIGFGIPDVELFAYLDEQRAGVSVDTLRYAPPERLDDQEEDARSDLYALAIIGAEMMLGRPVFDGPPEKVAERVINGDAPDLIEAIGQGLGDEALDLLCVSTERKPAHRFASIHEFLSQARNLAKSTSGDGLAALVAEALQRRDQDEEEDDPTDVVPLPQPPPAPIPSRIPAGQTDDDLVTESGLESDFALVDPVPPLPDIPTLEQVRAHARAIVGRSAQLAEQARAMEVIAVQRAHNMDDVGPVVRKLKEAVNKAQKASSSTANTAKLVELDDTIEDALVTLDMVRSAEKLCYAGTHRALEILFRVQAEVDQIRAHQQTLDRAQRQSREASDRARDSAQEAMEIVRTLETHRYTIDSSRELLQRARDRAATATSAAAKAKQAARVVSTKTRPPEAEREAQRARSAADDAKSALEDIRTVQRTLDEGEAEERDVLASKLRSCVARARSAALSALQSMERAENASQHATIPESSSLLRTMKRHYEAADAAADNCEAVAGPALDASRETPDATTKLSRALSAALSGVKTAETQSADCGRLSDRLVALAGEAAAAEAEIAKWKAEAQSILSRVDDRAAEVQLNWQALKIETEEVIARTARDAIQVAQRAAMEMEKHTAAFRESVAAIEATVDRSGLQDRVTELRASESDVLILADKAASRCREARAAASREIEEIARRNAEREKLKQAVDRARAHAERGQQAVRDAWKAYEEAVEVLGTASIAGADKLRARAYEIIDIAEYQAGEAEAAAEAAGSQADPDEAQSHAATAESFEKRIAEDLPEALDLLERARSQATAENTRLDEARTRITTAFADGREAVKRLEELRTGARDAAADWDDIAVTASLEQIDVLATGLDEDLSEVRYAADRAKQAESADDAWEMVPLAEAAAKRLLAARQEAEAVAATLDAAVRTARQEVETREAAVSAVMSSLIAIEKMRESITERAAGLRTAIATHDATGPEVMGASSRMSLAMEGSAAFEEEVRSALIAVRSATTASEAQAHQRDVEAAVARVQDQLEISAESHSEGVSAAEREAAERNASERRQLQHARGTALTHVQTAKLAAEKGMALLREAATELAIYDDPEVKRIHQKAREWVRVARTSATGALKAARECQRAKVAASAVEWEQRANGLATDAHNAVAEAGTLLREAVDIARRAEQEAEALKAVKAEIQSIRTMIVEGVQHAEADGAKVREVTAASTDEDTLACAEEADKAIRAVKRSAAKVDAAAPMALHADSLEVAQGLLNTCRAALLRADEAADHVRDLIQKAQQMLGQEAERAAQRLADARSEAERPAQEADAIAQKADDWVELGRQAADGVQASAVREALEALVECARETRRLADQAETAAAPARRAPNLRTAKAVGEKVHQAAQRTERAAERAREALDAVRAAVEAAATEDAEAQEFRIQAAEAAAAAEVCAADATGLAEDLEKLLSESGVVDDEAAASFREVKRTAKSIAASAALAFERTEDSMTLTGIAPVRQAVEQVEAARAEAEKLLAELHTHAVKCRELIEAVQRKAREDAKRKKDEALRAKLRRKRSQSKIMKREELKAQFQERENRPPPNLSSLRERLRARRREKDQKRGVDRLPPVRPETGALPNRRNRRRPEPDTSSRMRPSSEPASADDLQLSGPYARENSGPRTIEEKQRSRKQREERRRKRRTHDDSGPSLIKDAPTGLGIITPSGDTGGPQTNEGADALLRRLRQKRRDDD